MTVVIAVWDSPYVEHYSRAVRSVLRQDAEAPVVVVDNASTIDLHPVPGTRVINSSTRLSAGAARNLGLTQVETEFVIFLDADDELADGALRALTDGISGQPTIIALALSVLEGETGLRHKFPRPFAYSLARAPRLFALITAVWSLYPLHGCTILRTESVRQSGGHADCDRGEDWVLAVSQALRGEVVLDPRPGLIYHRRGETVLGVREVRSVHRRIRERIRSDPGVPQWARRLLPVIAVLQGVVSVAALPAYREARSCSARLRATRQARKAPGKRTSAHNGRQR